MAIGYGECWPGYIPTKKAFDEKFGHGWRWVAPGAEARIEAALRKVLLAPESAAVTKPMTWHSKKNCYRIPRNWRNT